MPLSVPANQDISIVECALSGISSIAPPFTYVRIRTQKRANGLCKLISTVPNSSTIIYVATRIENNMSFFYAYTSSNMNTQMRNKKQNILYQVQKATHAMQVVSILFLCCLLRLPIVILCNFQISVCKY